MLIGNSGWGTKTINATFQLRCKALLSTCKRGDRKTGAYTSAPGKMEVTHFFPSPPTRTTNNPGHYLYNKWKRIVKGGEKKDQWGSHTVVVSWFLFWPRKSQRRSRKKPRPRKQQWDRIRRPQEPALSTHVTLGGPSCSASCLYWRRCPGCDTVLSFTRRCHLGKLSKAYMGPLWIISYDCMWI